MGFSRKDKARERMDSLSGSRNGRTHSIVLCYLVKVCFSPNALLLLEFLFSLLSFFHNQAAHVLDCTFLFFHCISLAGISHSFRVFPPLVVCLSKNSLIVKEGTGTRVSGFFALHDNDALVFAKQQ